MEDEKRSKFKPSNLSVVTNYKVWTNFKLPKCPIV